MNLIRLGRILILVITVVLGTVATALAQRVNVRGYTRRDGTYVRPHTRSAPGTATAKPSTPSAPATVATAADSLHRPSGLPAPDTAPGAGDPVAYPWVASRADAVVFQRSCLAAQDLALGNRIYFGTELAALQAGYRRSRSPGC